MQGRGVLMVGLMYVHLCIFWLTLGVETASDATTIDFVGTIGKAVQAVATKVEDNDAKHCGLAKTCQCSRVECIPRKNANNLPGSKCVYTQNNTACPSKIDSPCNSIRANFLEGYVRIPPLDFKFENSIEGVVGNTICAQSSDLDATFITAYENIAQALQRIGHSNLRPFYTIRFGAVDGSYRYFPGLETINQSMCNKYEPRVRPWYTGAISVVKDLVILLDTGFEMLQTFSDLANVKSSSLLEVAKSMAASVMMTLTANDRATIVPFNESVSPGSKTWLVSAEGLSETAPQGIQDFIDSVGPESGKPLTNLASNFTAGFLKASSIFNDPVSPNQALKILILITNGKGPYSPSQQDLQTALDFEKQGVRLFVYEIPKENLNYISPWASVCCRIGGYSEKLDKFAVVVNPLSSVTSYFSFLARSRIAAQGAINPYWQVGHDSTNGLGNVITATSLAMSEDGVRLIGVVGINIQISGFFDKNLIARVQSYLSANELTIIPLYPNGTDIPNCNVSMKEGACGNQSTPTHVLCNLPDEVDLKATPASLLCCDGCGDIPRSTREKNKNLIIILTTCLAGGLVLLLSTCTWCAVKHFCPLHPSEDVDRPLKIDPLLTYNRPETFNRPFIVAYSFKDICMATNDFDDSNHIAHIGTNTNRVQYTGNLEGEMVVVIKWLSGSDPEAEIDNYPRQLTLKGTSSGPANQQVLNGNNYGPSDRFSVFRMSEYQPILG